MEDSVKYVASEAVRTKKRSGSERSNNDNKCEALIFDMIAP